MGPGEAGEAAPVVVGDGAVGAVAGVSGAVGVIDSGEDPRGLVVGGLGDDVAVLGSGG